MGRRFYCYFVPWQEELNAALRAQRQQEFEAAVIIRRFDSLLMTGLSTKISYD